MEKTLQPGAAAQLVGLPLTRTRDDDAKPFFKFRYAQFKNGLLEELDTLSSRLVSFVGAGQLPVIHGGKYIYIRQIYRPDNRGVFPGGVQVLDYDSIRGQNKSLSVRNLYTVTTQLLRKIQKTRSTKSNIRKPELPNACFRFQIWRTLSSSQRQL